MGLISLTLAFVPLGIGAFVLIMENVEKYIDGNGTCSDTPAVLQAVPHTTVENSDVPLPPTTS